MVFNEDEYFESADLALVAALVEHEFTPVRLDRSNSRRVLFLFGDTEALQDAVTDYWLDKLTVNPKTYFDTLKHLKSRIYAS